MVTIKDTSEYVVKKKMLCMDLHRLVFSEMYPGKSIKGHPVLVIRVNENVGDKYVLHTDNHRLGQTGLFHHNGPYHLYVRQVS